MVKVYEVELMAVVSPAIMASDHSHYGIRQFWKVANVSMPDGESVAAEKLLWTISQ